MKHSHSQMPDLFKLDIYQCISACRNESDCSLKFVHWASNRPKVFSGHIAVQGGLQQTSRTSPVVYTSPPISTAPRDRAPTAAHLRYIAYLRTKKRMLRAQMPGRHFKVHINPHTKLFLFYITACKRVLCNYRFADSTNILFYIKPCWKWRCLDDLLWAVSTVSLGINFDHTYMVRIKHHFSVDGQDIIAYAVIEM